MSQDEILNYDPSHRSPNEKLIEFREVVFYDSNKAPIRSIYVPASELTNKTDEEIRHYILRVFLARKAVDVTKIELNNDEAERISRAIANTYAHYYAKCLVGNLMVIYGKRIIRGDGVDLEIEIVDKAESSNQSPEVVERESAALDRIIDHLLARNRTAIADDLVKRRDMITEFWRLVLDNVAAHTILLIGDKKGNPFSLPKKEFLSEFMSISKEIWWNTFNLTLESAGERIASKVLQRLNPAGIPFQELKEMIRGGLDACPTFQDDDLRQLANGIKKIIAKDGITFHVSGDGSRLSIELPKESELSNFNRLVDRQDALIKYLLEPSKRGPKPDPKKKNKYREFAAAVNKKEDIARYLSEFAKKHIFSDWIKQLAFDWHYPELCKGYDEKVIREAEQVLCKYQSDSKLSKTTTDHATSPLGVAQIIAAVEMGLRDTNGSLRSINTLNEWYRQGGGSRWKNSPR